VNSLYMSMPSSRGLFLENEPGSRGTDLIHDEIGYPAVPDRNEFLNPAPRSQN